MYAFMNFLSRRKTMKHEVMRLASQGFFFHGQMILCLLWLLFYGWFFSSNYEFTWPSIIIHVSFDTTFGLSCVWYLICILLRLMLEQVVILIQVMSFSRTRLHTRNFSMVSFGKLKERWVFRYLRSLWSNPHLLKCWFVGSCGAVKSSC